MKLIVLSDTHGGRRRIDEVMARHPDYDALIFLGDGLADLFGNPYRGTVCVRGNCDLSWVMNETCDAPAERVMTFDGIRFFMAHGHTLSVKSGLFVGMERAYESGADVFIYGHTHEPLERYFPEGSEFGKYVTDRPMYAFNPGSLGAPRGSRPSFGVVEIRNGEILFSHGAL